MVLARTRQARLSLRRRVLITAPPLRQHLDPNAFDTSGDVSTKAQNDAPHVRRPGLIINREAFNDIYLNFSKKNGVTRFAESGFGWKPASGGDGSNFTLDASQIVSAQWSRAARGWEIKVLSKDRKDSVIQLDGFKQDVSEVAQTNPMIPLTGAGL